MATRAAFSRRESALFEQRQERRHRVECVRTTAGGEGEVPFVAALDDVSTYGCRLSGTDILAAGKQVWLRLPGAPPIVAAVAWTRDGKAGCRFETPISQSLMRSLLTGA